MSRTPRLRWKLGLGIFLLCIALHAALWQLLSPDRTYQLMAAWGTVSFTVFMTVVWWTFLSGVLWATRWKGLGAAVACVVVFFLTVEVEGYQGDMMPRLRLRWSPSREEVAEEFWKDADKSNAKSTDTESNEDVSELKIRTDDWPGFRGPNRDGIVRGAKIRTDWNAEPPKELWRHPVGLGWSSFAVVDRFAFTQEQRREQEALVCYDLETGQQIWAYHVDGRFSEEMGGDGPRATPTVFDSRVYTLTATGVLSCVEARTGRKLWSVDILADAKAENLDWAMAGSPLVYDDLVVVNPGGSEEHSVTAYDRKTGDKVWSAGDHVASYCAPRLETIADVRQVLVFHGIGLSGYDPVDGRQLWEFPWSNGPHVNAAQPIAIAGGRILIGCGYGVGSVVIDISEANSGGEIRVVKPWPTNRLKLKFNDAVVRDGYVYGLDEGILTCLDLETAKPQWKRGRYGYGQLLLIDDVLLVQTEKGDVVLVEASPTEHRQITKLEALTDKTWNHPVVVRGKLLVRNSEEAVCFDVSTGQ